MAIDNPARVLYDVFDRGRSTDTPQDAPAVNVWSQVFGGLSGGALARKLARVQQLPDEVRATVTRLDIDPQPVDRAMDRLEAAFLDLGSYTWVNFWNAFGGDSALDTVQITAAFIDAASSVDDRYPIEDVEGLREQLAQLYSDIEGSDLPDDVKRLVRSRLLALLQELEQFDVSTTVYFRDLVNSFVGLLATADTIFNAIKKSAIGKAILSVLAALVVVHGAAGVTGNSAIPLGPADQSIVRCLDPHRVPALPPPSNTVAESDH